MEAGKRKATSVDKLSQREQKIKRVESSSCVVEKKSRKQHRNDVREKGNWCFAFFKGKCDRSVGTCKFSHDIDAYLQSKSPPLPGSCIFPEICPYGVTCRFDHDVKSESVLPALPDVAKLENGLSLDTRQRLRNRTYDFTKADSVLSSMRIKNERSMVDETSLELPLRSNEKRRIDFEGKLYLAPLTTLGNLPFRRMCIDYGADITCSEMSLATNLLQGRQTEWALLKRHPCEKIFGIQICGGFADSLTRCAQLIEDTCQLDFIDVNLGCPIDSVCIRCGGAALLQKPKRIRDISKAMSAVMVNPLILKMRKGYHDNADVVHQFLPEVYDWGVSAVTLHGRTRAQRYTRLADWAYIYSCAEKKQPPLQLIGNGDIFSFTEWEEHISASNGTLATCMIGRAALIKPWIFTEVKERRHWDITSSERLEMLKLFCARGLEHWGSDHRGVETTRRFLLEWLSFLYRYVPVGLLEVVPQTIHERLLPVYGRDELENLFLSSSAEDWIKISEKLLGPVPEGFTFCPKHKSNAYPPLETITEPGILS